ncbi:DUF4112 domain-containing protein [Aliifodinibius salicampi]|uniref:DUF4112 domain-containing protein n=1 Tax=Fodinibius salicampi TaxID=1920655 RepID=A0ABT3Q2X7_9BACT|nr:DUF4112 domain-containing protein [Fodinibius salicampi]MCW9714463.1 DUF4112 domain-containing protein [Fodinibius salicampi]
MDNNQNAQKVTKLAEWLDSRFTIPGTNIRFGLDPIISLIPGAGDWLAGIISGYFILLGARADLPPAVLWRMGFNVLIDIVIGSVPLLGDLFDVGWKANNRNAELLEKYRRDAKTTEHHSRWLLWIIAITLILMIVGLLALLGWLIASIIEILF